MGTVHLWSLYRFIVTDLTINFIVYTYIFLILLHTFAHTHTQTHIYIYIYIYISYVVSQRFGSLSRKQNDGAPIIAQMTDPLVLLTRISPKIFKFRFSLDMVKDD